MMVFNEYLHGDSELIYMKYIKYYVYDVEAVQRSPQLRCSTAIWQVPYNE